MSSHKYRRRVPETYLATVALALTAAALALTAAALALTASALALTAAALALAASVLRATLWAGLCWLLPLGLYGQ